MWELKNQTRYEAEQTFLRDKDGAEVWIVVVRGTFDIQPDGAASIATDQLPVVRAPAYQGELGRSSLQYDSDLAFTKHTTDVVLHGYAYAPDGRPAEEVDVLLSVGGSIEKTLRVVGDRRWVARDDSLTPPEPFLRMAITYERAYGGADREDENVYEPRNPVGTGLVPKEGSLAPNVLPLDGSEQELVAFGPIPRAWEPRVALAGTYDDAWRESRFPLLPLNFDERFFQCAPRDQQPESWLEGGEEIRLINLSPEGELTFELPRVRLFFETTFVDETVEHPARLHTVIIEPEERRLHMVWQTRLDCHPKVNKLIETTIVEEGWNPPVDEEDDE